ncbi:MAG: RibD family protein, partial [Chitinophagaceae bacterium]
PFVILKWAQTADGKIAAPSPVGGISGSGNKRLKISNEYSDRLVHQWRSEEAAILVGTNTALLDDPELTTRLWPGNSPVRLVVDMNLRLPASLKIFNGQVKTVVFNTIKNEEVDNLFYYKLEKSKNLVHQLMDALFAMNLQSVLVEGGARLLQSFIDENLWDEIKIITNNSLKIGEGLAAPEFAGGLQKEEKIFLTDTIRTWINN